MKNIKKSEEVILVPTESGWLYEHFNNDDWNLDDLNINYINEIIEIDSVINILNKKFPNAVMTIYETQHDWEQDKKSVCYR